MHDRPPFLPFDDDEGAWLPELPRPQASAPPRFGADTASRAEDGRNSCPTCQSVQTEPRHVARRIGGAVGAAAGATGAIALALSGVETGAAIGMIGGPVGAICGSLAGAILAGLVAGAAGCATGAAFGEALDQKVLNGWRCLACGRTFTVHSG
ncbi:hypothetical protein [Burkholderia pseudomallei]|uniref:hypothetical protein n=1 Tax=Burkholderia pseudomallei TaxID=28450 RepID=UPI001AAE8622|nr:hypothetical protein [Burkholderia pseudomallei]MBO2953689.1 hypothetical protein [Burkholderia pseudomallei]